MNVPQIAWREKHARGTLSVLISCIVHTAILIGLALTYVATRHDRPITILQAVIAGSDEIALDYSEVTSVEPPAGSELPTATPQLSQDFDLNVQAELTTTRPVVDATLTSALASVASITGNGSVSDSSGGTGSGTGNGSGVGDELNKLGASFFGSYATGEKFVFVLDSSRSMTGERWLYACQELMDSVNRLQPHQKFYVLCFDEVTTCMFNSPAARISYQTNTPEIRVRLKRWLATRRLGPNTLPAEAMGMALKLHPDAIFLLSDGELRDETLFLLRQANGFSTERHQVPIHTVHMMSQEGRQTLQVIAQENSGTFTPVQGRSF